MNPREQLFSELVKIQEELNQQIIQPSNRFDHLECVPKDADLDEAIINLKKHRKFITSKSHEYTICKHIQEKFDDLLQKKKISSIKELTEDDWLSFRAKMHAEASHLCTRLAKIAKYLGHESKIDVPQIELSISANLDKLRNNEPLFLEKELADRFSDSDSLVEHRHIADSQFQIPSYLQSTKETKDQLENGQKTYFLWRGLYFSKANSPVAFCDEHAVRTLHESYKRGLITSTTTVEKVSVEFGDGVNHTFLVYNRDPNSDLSDISTWGDEAIISDAWNKLTCYAKDYAKLPVRYPLLHKNGKWSSVKFDRDDWFLYSHLTELDMHFSMTENETMEKRLPLLVEEYQLTDLTSPQYQETRTLLETLAQEVLPDNFNATIEFLITTSSAEPFTIINGFNQPKIAINKSFLSKVNIDYTVDELRYGLCRALYHVKFHGVTTSEELSTEEHHDLDRMALLKCKNSSAAISFLRKSNEMAKKNVSSSKIIAALNPQRAYTQISKSTYEQRIKNLMTALAADERLRENQSSKPLSLDKIIDEIKHLQEFSFFKEKFSQCKDVVQQLEYLTSCLPELKVELQPYESTQKLNKRGRDFVHLLYSMKIDFKDKKQTTAVDNFINAALALRVPCFDRIYLAICNVKHDANPMPRLTPFGKFKAFYRAIYQFRQAQSLKEADVTATQVLLYYQELQNHLKNYPHNGRHVERYREKHHCFPKGTERFFGSTIGTLINWPSFQETTDQKLPWAMHAKWALEAKETNIAMALWRLGVTKDRSFWPRFDRDTLWQSTRRKPLFKLPGKLAKYSHARYEREDNDHYPLHVVHYLSQRHKLDNSMFHGNASFEESLYQFYEKNWPMLVLPGLRDKDINLNNDATNYLLTKFVEVALLGTPAEKKIVKDFFLDTSYQKKFSLLALCSANKQSSSLHYNSPYIQFVIQQQYKQMQVNLFTNEEIRQFVSQFPLFRTGEIPTLQHVKMQDLPHQALTLDCLQALLAKFKIDKGYHPKERVILEHLSQYSYPLISPEAALIINLTFDHVGYFGNQKQILNKFKWSIPSLTASLDHISCSDLITIYRGFDSLLLFPNHKQQKQFSQLIFKKIQSLPKGQERITALENLLFKNKFYPLNDLSFRNQCIKFFAEELVSLYGKDTAERAYYDTITPVIERIFENTAKRDRRLILSNLANAIESQYQVSCHIGVLLDPEKNVLRNPKSQKSSVIGSLANLSQTLSKDKNDQTQFIHFISSPLTEDSVNSFINYLEENDRVEKVFDEFGHVDLVRPRTEQERKQYRIGLDAATRKLHNEFWDLSLAQRAVVMDYLLIPANKVTDEKANKTAYQEALSYVAKKLFPKSDRDPDENFALSFLTSYLDNADPYIRSYLLAGMLVASSEGVGKRKLSVGKRLVMLCEHMGPAYIKLAQAIHSHPDTPEHIRKDFDHIKGRANPLDRWDLWDLIYQVVPEHERDQIERIGALLGSASYNLALEAKLKTGEDRVLLLLRENAAKDAQQGFKHLSATVRSCQHPRLIPVRATALSMITEAEMLSALEMDPKASREQYKIAGDIYHYATTVMVDNILFSVQMIPSTLYSNGDGYRFAQRMYGTAFNSLPNATPYDKRVRKAAASAVIKKELINILSGGFFDSDRHGNNLNVLIDPVTRDITLGLFDFGELGLEKPNDEEINQLANFIRDMPHVGLKGIFFSSAFDQLLSNHIDKVLSNGQSAKFLMRVRKAFLALQDFQKVLSTRELLEVVKSLYQSKEIHPAIRRAMLECEPTLNKIEQVYKLKDTLLTPVTFFTKSTPAALFDSPLPSNNSSSAPSGKREYLSSKSFTMH